jgi:phospholipase C
VDAVMNSKYWSSTAIFIMDDDWGGFYDPIVPGTLPNISPGNSTQGPQGLGFRVSALLVSPYANEGIVNTVFSFESILHFIDYNWGMPMLNERVMDANNMLSDFNFHQNPLPAWTGTPLTPQQMKDVLGNASLNTPISE